MAMVRSRSRALPPRAIAIGLTILLHLAMLAALVASGADPVSPRRDVRLSITLALPQTMSESDRTASVLPTADRANPPPKLPSEPAPVPLPPAPGLATEMPIAEPQLSVADLVASGPQFDAEPDPAHTGDAASAAMTGTIAPGAGTQCPLVASLRAALQQDMAARAAIARIPRPSRSVANAVMLWDGRWIAPERVGGTLALTAIRAAVARVVGNGSEACRSQITSGPVFVPVDDDSGTVVLALGSGTWRPADLLSVDFPGSVDPLSNDRQRTQAIPMK